MPVEFDRLPVLFARLQLNAQDIATQTQIAAIDAALPQTQCGLCGHADGCLPYATAIVTKGEAYNQCVPGGQPVADAIAALLNKPSLPAKPSKWATDPVSERPSEIRAIIREDDCIGCTKCITACPVDAIIGSGKQMHTIFVDWCTGCELCLPPCPVDCIDLYPVAPTPAAERPAQQADLRARYHAHLRRVERQVNDQQNAQPVVSMVQAKLNDSKVQVSANQAKTTIEAAKLRTQIKKLQKQLAARANPAKQAELERLMAELAALQSANATSP